MLTCGGVYVWVETVSEIMLKGAALLSISIFWGLYQYKIIRYMRPGTRMVSLASLPTRVGSNPADREQLSKLMILGRHPASLADY